MKKNKVHKLISFLAGVDYETLTQCSSSEINKYSIIASTVVIPALLSCFTIGYCMWVVTGSFLAVSIACLVWPAVILVIERSFIANIKPYQFNITIVLRFIGISATISEVLLIGIFRDSIDEKIAFNHNARLQKVAAKYDNTIKGIESEIEKKKESLDKKQSTLFNEIDGIKGKSSGYRGYGISSVKKEIALNQEVQFFNEYNNRQNGNLLKLKTLKENELNEINRNKANKLLSKIRALSQLANEDFIVQISCWLVRVLFLILETLPLFIKLTSGDKNGSLYHEIASKNERLQMLLIEKTSEEQLQLMEMKKNLSLLKEKMELNTLQMELLMNSQLSHMRFYNERLQQIISLHLSYKEEAIQKIKEKELLSQVIFEIDSIFESYINTLENLLSKSISYHKIEALSS
jgi:hypothetical protein